MCSVFHSTLQFVKILFKLRLVVGSLGEERLKVSRYFLILRSELINESERARSMAVSFLNVFFQTIDLVLQVLIHESSSLQLG